MVMFVILSKEVIKEAEVTTLSYIICLAIAKM